MTRFRRSLRRKNFDYTRDADYFVTICVQKRLQLFGQIEDGKMILNDAGKMIWHWFTEIQNKFPDWQCDKTMIMPDHFHAIIGKGIGFNSILTNPSGGPMCPLGKPTIDLREGRPVCPQDLPAIEHSGGPVCPPGVINRHAEQQRYNASLFTVMQWFKTMTTNAYIR